MGKGIFYGKEFLVWGFRFAREARIDFLQINSSFFSPFFKIKYLLIYCPFFLNVVCWPETGGRSLVEKKVLITTTLKLEQRERKESECKRKDRKGEP